MLYSLDSGSEITSIQWWLFGRYEKNGMQISGLTYFQIAQPK